MRTYKLYFGLGFFISYPFGKRSYDDSDISYYWYSSYGPAFTMGVLLTRHFYIALNVKVFLTKYFERISTSYGYYDTGKPVVIGFETGFHF